MKTRQQSLHDEGGQSRAGKEGDAHKLDDVRVAEGTHQLALSHELISGSANLGSRDLGAVQEDVMDLLGGADGSGNSHFLHAAVGSSPDPRPSQPHTGENEPLQLGIVAKKLLLISGHGL